MQGDLDREALRATLHQWLLRSRVALRAYNDAANAEAIKERRLGIPASFISALVGSSVFAMLSTNPGIAWQVATGFLALVSSALAGLAAFLRPAERAEEFRAAARKYGAVRRRIERELLFLPTNLKEAKELLEELSVALDEAAAGNPNAPRRWWRIADFDIRGRRTPSASNRLRHRLSRSSSSEAQITRASTDRDDQEVEVKK